MGENFSVYHAGNGVYMRDYTEDEDGHIACVSFDLIRKE